MPPSAPIHSERRFLLLVLAGGVALRLWLLAARGDGLTSFYGAGEATRVALALARGDGFTDAYYAGYGPTAHLLPVSPAIAGLAFRLFGSSGGLVNLVLLGWALAQTVVGYWLLRRLSVALDMDPLASRWGLALLCLAPVFMPQETVDFRYWESGLAVMLATGGLLLAMRIDTEARTSARILLAAGLLAALTFFVSPAAGLGLYACLGWVAVRRFGWLRAVGLGALCGVALALLVVPWALRNQAALGQPVLLRSNFGLELAIGNHPGAVDSPDPAKTYADRLLEVHPFHSPAARLALQRDGGEIAYSRRLGAGTRAWIAAHPLAFAQLATRHLTQFFLPRPWQFYFTGWEEWRSARAMLVSAIGAVGLLALAWGIVLRRRGFGLLFAYVGVTALPYALVQPIPRYSYLVYGLLAFVAVDAAVRLGRYGIAGAEGAGWAR